MSALALKAEIHRKVDDLNDISELTDLNQSLDWFIQAKLTAEEKTVLKRLGQIQQDADQNKGIAREEVMKEAKSWLKK